MAHGRRLASRDIGTPGQIAESQNARAGLPRLECELSAIRAKRAKVVERAELHRSREQQVPQVSGEVQALLDGGEAERETIRAQLATAQRQLSVIHQAITAVRKVMDREKATRNRERLRDEFLPQHVELYQKLRAALLELKSVRQNELLIRQDVT